jgi:Cu-Zn family superoxide dismutase
MLMRTGGNMKTLALTSLIALLAFGCSHTRPSATATLEPTSAASTAHGTVAFQDTGDGNVEVTIDLTSVPPGVHGFHIHDKGDCGNAGNNAGGHFNPTGMVHGAPDAVSHHAGDFGNVTAEANGEVHTHFTTHSISLAEGSTTSAIGHAVVLHGNPDDLVTQPTGNAGPRIACGVVVMAKMPASHP